MMFALLAWVALLATAWLLQGPLQPTCLRPQQIPIKWRILEAVLLSIPFILTLLLTQRVLLATLTTLTLLITPIIVNHAKYRALREPLVFSDFFLYIQVFTHPRLFLPFLNLPLTILAISAGITALICILWLEPRIDIAPWPWILLLLISIFYCRHQGRQGLLTLNPIEDIQRLGFYNSLLLSSIQAAEHQRKEQLQQRILKHSPFIQPGSSIAPLKRKPDLIVIQSESFCDIRQLSTSIRSDVLQHFDQIRKAAIAEGPLIVPAWGANTLRPEFAFLSGIDNALLEHYRFNPYQYLQQQPTPTLVSYLRDQGYYTVCIHPNHAAFFKRDRVFPLLGFETFLDINDFDQAERDGPYISDAAVTDKLISILKQPTLDRPLFIFVMTMENHGPLHLETLPANAAETFYNDIPLEQHHDLSVYLNHLKHADQMLKRLTDYLQSSPHETRLCWYGDHVPSMPDVYSSLNVDTLHSHYLIWQNTHNKWQTKEGNQEQPLKIETLSTELLRHLSD